jgi:uncharacterized protein (DUF1684 family)
MRALSVVNVLSAAATSIVLAHAFPAIAQAWRFRGVVAAGEQFDAGPSGVVRLS